MIKYLSKYESWDVLDQIYKLYIRPHLDYGDIIYHRHDPEMMQNFTIRLEQTQYSAALAVTGAWRGTNRQKLYKELGWESLYNRRWFRRLVHFFNLRRTGTPDYLYAEMPMGRSVQYDLRNKRMMYHLARQSALQIHTLQMLFMNGTCLMKLLETLLLWLSSSVS